jgi:hypothetical protein
LLPAIELPEPFFRAHILLLIGSCGEHGRNFDCFKANFLSWLCGLPDLMKQG